MSNQTDNSQNLLFYRIKSVMKHSLVYGLFDFLGKAGAIILVPLYAKMLGPAEYGMLELFTVTASLLLITGIMGFNSALTRYYVTEEQPDEQNRIFQTALLSVLFVAGIIALILILSAPLVSRIFFGTQSYALYWRILFITVFSDSITGILLALYRSQTRPGLYSTINFTKLILTLGLNVVFVGFLREGIYGVLIGNLLGSACGLGLSLVFSARLIRLKFSKRYLVLLSKFGLPLLVSGFAFFVLNSADRYFLKHYTGLADLGAYALGYKVGMLMSLAVNAFVVAWPPLMFKIVGDPHADKTFATVLTYYLFVSCAILIAVGSFGYEIVRVIGTPQYAAASGIIVYILMSYLFQGAYYIMSTGAIVTDHTKVIPVIVGVCALINTGANLALIPPYGMMGAAIATVISYAFLPVGMYFASQRYFKIDFERRRILKVVFATVVTLGLNAVIIGHAGIAPAGAKLAVVLSYPFILLGMRFFTEEELTRIKLAVRKALARTPSKVS